MGVFLLVDSGGGTTDLGLYRTTEVEPLRLEKEINPPSGRSYLKNTKGKWKLTVSQGPRVDQAILMSGCERLRYPIFAIRNTSSKWILSKPLLIILSCRILKTSTKGPSSGVIDPNASDMRSWVSRHPRTTDAYRKDVTCWTSKCTTYSVARIS